MGTSLNRSIVLNLKNKSGVSVNKGDVVILDSTDELGFTVTGSAGLSTDSIGVVINPTQIANNESGLICMGGYVPQINLVTGANLGDTFNLSSTAKYANSHATVQAGDFGQVLSVGTTPKAYLWGVPNTTSDAEDIGARVYNSGSISCANGIITTGTFNAEIYDTDDIHSTIIHTNRLTCQTAGKYLVAFQFVFESTVPAGSGVWIQHSSRGRVAQMNDVSLGTISTIINLEVGDWVMILIFMNGSTINLLYSGGNEYSPFFEMQKIG